MYKNLNLLQVFARQEYLKDSLQWFLCGTVIANVYGRVVFTISCKQPMVTSSVQLVGKKNLELCEILVYGIFNINIYFMK